MSNIEMKAGRSSKTEIDSKEISENNEGIPKENSNSTNRRAAFYFFNSTQTTSASLANIDPADSLRDIARGDPNKFGSISGAKQVLIIWLRGLFTSAAAFYFGASSLRLERINQHNTRTVN